MKLISILCFLVAGAVLTASDDEPFRAKINIDSAENAVMNERGMMFLPAVQTQKEKGILFEAEQMNALEYHYGNTRIQQEKDHTSIWDVKFMEYRFTVTKPGKYRTWYYATYPTNLGYLHSEFMDGGEKIQVQDSHFLAPNFWRWHSGPVYELNAGEHVWTFPSPGAWCGKTKLDKLMLLPEQITSDPEKFTAVKTAVTIPAKGEVKLRRIKASLLKQWMFDCALELNGGSFSAEYRYDDEKFQPIVTGKWMKVPANAKYLYFRFQLMRAKKQMLSPFVHNISLMVVEK